MESHHDGIDVKWLLVCVHMERDAQNMVNLVIIATCQKGNTPRYHAFLLKVCVITMSFILQVVADSHCAVIVDAKPSTIRQSQQTSSNRSKGHSEDVVEVSKETFLNALMRNLYMDSFTMSVDNVWVLVDMYQLEEGLKKLCCLGSLEMC